MQTKTETAHLRHELKRRRRDIEDLAEIYTESANGVSRLLDDLDSDSINACNLEDLWRAATADDLAPIMRKAIIRRLPARPYLEADLDDHPALQVQETS